MSAPSRPSPVHRLPVSLAFLGLAAGVSGAGLLAGLLFAVGALHPTRSTTTIASNVTQAAASSGGSPAASTLYARVAPGVVDITSQVTAELPTPFGTRSAETMQLGAGSVLDAEGRILTAQHVVAGASSITVAFQDGRHRAAKVLGEDSASDIALLKVDAAGLTLHPLTLGSLRSLRVGDVVFVIGDPFGYARSLSSGIVSGLDRTIEAPNGFTVAHAIQTDAALNPGNSGGPLLDTHGLVIGVADQIATSGSGDASNTGVGFAVPIDVVRSILPQLERGATPTHAYLGVGATDAADTNGALVQSVRSASPAAFAGLKVGDIILAVGPVRITGVSDLVAAIAAHHTGDRISVTVARASQQLTVKVTLAEQPHQAASG